MVWPDQWLSDFSSISNWEQVTCKREGVIMVLIFKTMVFILTSIYAIQLMSNITKVVLSIPIFNLLWLHRGLIVRMLTSSAMDRGFEHHWIKPKVKHLGLVQSRHHHHLIKRNLLFPWKIAHWHYTILDSHPSQGIVWLSLSVTCSRWFVSLCTLVSSTNKTDHHDIT